MSHQSRLVLGTAQLGMPYGIANRSGQPDLDEAIRIIKTAWESGIHEFDTAQAYGQSEEILGQSIRELQIGNLAKITTKLHPELNHLDSSIMRQALKQSLDRLNVGKLHCLMLHREEMMDLSEDGLRDILKSFVTEGLVEHIGVSVYSPSRALQAISTEGIEIIQLPTNILDRRFEKADVFEAAKKEKKETYIRSVFLQGLILMMPQELPDNLALARPYVEKILSLSRENKISERQLALGYVKYAMPNAKIVVGIENSMQLNQIIHDFDTKCPSSVLAKIKAGFENVDEKIINPSRWQRG